MNKPGTYRFVPAAHRGRRSDDRLRVLAVEQLCHAMPIGAAALDAYGNFLFCNREGVDLLSRWSAGQPVTKSPWYPKAVPAEIVAACERLRAGRAGPGQRSARPNFGGRILVRNEGQPSLTAVVALDRNPRDRRFAIFSVLFQDALRASVGGGRRDQLALLTLAERRVAKLVAEGLRNSDIAATLGKSVMTVKSQLGAIFSKLSVQSRTQLAAVLRPSDAG
jgi:DNA-binding CsgD family transcriptional regulator